MISNYGLGASKDMLPKRIKVQPLEVFDDC